MVSFTDARTVVSTDVLVEGHHFRTEWSTGRDVGERAAAQNLADAAAMGAAGRPRRRSRHAADHAGDLGAGLRSGTGSGL